RHARQTFELTYGVDRVSLRASGAGYEAAGPPHEPLARSLHKVVKQDPIWLCLGLRCRGEKNFHQFHYFEVIFLLNSLRPSGLFMAGTKFINVAPDKRWKLDCRSEEHTSELQSRVDLVCRL